MSKGSTKRWGARQVVAVVAVGTVIVLGLALVLLASAPTVLARVVSSERDPASGVSQVVITTPDGVKASWPSYADTPGVGTLVAAVQLPNGALVEPGLTEMAREVGVVLVVLGLLIGSYFWWRARHPDPPNKTLVTPGESFVLPPIKMPGGGMG